ILGSLMTVIILGKVDMHIYRITDDPYELAMLEELRRRRRVWTDKVRNLGKDIQAWQYLQMAAEGALSGGRGYYCSYAGIFGRHLQEEKAALQALQSDWDAFADFSFTEMAFPDGWTPTESDLQIA